MGVSMNWGGAFCGCPYDNALLLGSTVVPLIIGNSQIKQSFNLDQAQHSNGPLIRTQ